MKNNKKAFTMIELVFVIVVLGILAAVAIPRLAASRGDAQLVTAKANVASIRSAIVNERQSRLFRGDPRFITLLDQAANNAVGANIFGGLPAGVMVNTNGILTLLPYPIVTGAGNGSWTKTGALAYVFSAAASNGIPAGNAAFNYVPATGIFDCAGGAGTVCGALTD